MATLADFALLQGVTCDCKDDGVSFQITQRIDFIKQYLADTKYQLIADEDLFLLYGKQPLSSTSQIILLSSHIDCVYGKCFCSEEEDFYRGTFDNSFTNAALLSAMKSDSLNSDVFIAFTGDEEKDSGGAIAVNVYMGRLSCRIQFAIILDVTTTGWNHGCLFSIENDIAIDLFTAHHIVELLKPYESQYEYIHFAEPDEAWDYADYGIPTFTLSAPVCGDMHSDDGVLIRKETFSHYRSVLICLANGITTILNQKNKF